MARIGGLEEEFKKKPVGYFTKQELAKESQFLNAMLQDREQKGLGTRNMQVAYLHHKKTCRVKKEKDGRVVVAAVFMERTEDYAKYQKIYDAWASSRFARKK